METRPAIDSDLQPVQSALQSYADTYSRRIANGRDPQEFVDGRPLNIEDAGWLHYEGTDAWFKDGALSKSMPWLVMNVLVKSHNGQWIVIESTNEVAVSHRDLDRPITFLSLNDGSWLEKFDYDEPPAVGEVALDSYSELLRLFAKKRIFGSSRPPT